MFEVYYDIFIFGGNVIVDWCFKMVIWCIEGEVGSLVGECSEDGFIIIIKWVFVFVICISQWIGQVKLYIIINQLIGDCEGIIVIVEVFFDIILNLVIMSG